jgi:hypothetical protein|tara:strand:- start:153 stop:371 length:219 start_codon:yes stop_codon:yes gene_type:complete
MDFYLKKENTFERLLKEYKAYDSLVVAFDFDNTVYDFHQVGLDLKDVIILLQKLKKAGCYLIVLLLMKMKDL